MSVKLSVWTLLMDRCPKALQNRRGGNGEEGMSLFFRRYETCMLLNVVAKKDGYVYVEGCEYSRVSDACILSIALVALFVTAWTVAHQDLLSMGFSRKEDGRRLSFPTPI